MNHIGARWLLEYAHLLILLQRQHVLLILQENDTFITNLSEQCRRLRRVQRLFWCILSDAALVASLDKLEESSHSVVDDVLSYLIGLDIELEGIATESCRARHFQIQSCYGCPVCMSQSNEALSLFPCHRNSLCSAVGAPPIAHHESLPAPFSAQHLVEQLVVLAAVRSIDTIVSRHEGGRLGILDYKLKGERIDLAQSSLSNHGLDGIALVLVVVADKVLDRGQNALGLDTSDESCGS
jgi:hypothetical protein